jgi:hypothetical protein
VDNLGPLARFTNLRSGIPGGSAAGPRGSLGLVTATASKCTTSLSAGDTKEASLGAVTKDGFRGRRFKDWVGPSNFSEPLAFFLGRRRGNPSLAL